MYFGLSFRNGLRGGNGFDFDQTHPRMMRWASPSSSGSPRLTSPCGEWAAPRAPVHMDQTDLMLTCRVVMCRHQPTTPSIWRTAIAVRPISRQPLSRKLPPTTLLLSRASGINVPARTRIGGSPTSSMSRLDRLCLCRLCARAYARSIVGCGVAHGTRRLRARPLEQASADRRPVPSRRARAPKRPVVSHTSRQITAPGEVRRRAFCRPRRRFSMTCLPNHQRSLPRSEMIHRLDHGGTSMPSSSPPSNGLLFRHRIATGKPHRHIPPAEAEHNALRQCWNHRPSA